MNLGKTLLFLLVLIFQSAFSKTVIFKDQPKPFLIGKSIEYFIDSTNQLTIDDIITKKFIPSNKDVPNFGSSPNSFWIKIVIENHSNHNQLLIEIGKPNLNNVQLFSFKKGTWSVKKLGENYPFSTREMFHPSNLFKIDIFENMTSTFYARIKSEESIVMPIFLGTNKSFEKKNSSETLFFGIYFGLMMVMFLYNLFIYFTVRDKSYLYYISYVLAIALTQASLQGYAFQYLWPNSVYLAKHSLNFLPCCVSISANVFITKFLKTKIHTPLFHSILNIITVIFIPVGILSFFSDHHTIYTTIQITVGTQAVFVLLTAIYTYRVSPESAGFFLMAWIILLIGLIIYTLKELGLLPHNLFTHYTMQIGSAVETILLSFALANRINIMRRDTQKAQQERQKALEQQLKTAQTLDQTQSELIKTARMASVGRTTARIAHELNTPIYNARTTAQHVTTQTKELLEHIPSDTKAKLEEYQNNIEKMSSGLMTSINRAAKLVSNFRQTSADQTNIQKKYFKLKDYINTIIVSHEIMLHKKQIIVNLTGSNPIIYTDPGLTYQLIQNLVTNTEKYGYPDGNGTIDINIKKTDTELIITYKDYGKGIPQETLPHIFKPFYTTGEDKGGIGLGLSIIHSVVTEHLQGNISCDSVEGNGVTFTIYLNREKVS